MSTRTVTHGKRMTLPSDKARDIQLQKDGMVQGLKMGMMLPFTHYDGTCQYFKHRASLSPGSSAVAPKSISCQHSGRYLVSPGLLTATSLSSLCSCANLSLKAGPPTLSSLCSWKRHTGLAAPNSHSLLPSPNKPPIWELSWWCDLSSSLLLRHMV